MTDQPYRFQYEAIEGPKTAEPLGGAGASGDYIEQLIIVVTDDTLASVTLIDGPKSLLIFPKKKPPQSQIGTHYLPMHCVSQSGSWKITVGAGCTVIAMGIFRV